MIRSVLIFLLAFSFYASAQEQKKSIGFAENKGQIVDQKGNLNPDVKYLLNSNGLNVQLRKNGFSYDVYEVEKVDLTAADLLKQSLLNSTGSVSEEFSNYSMVIKYHRVDVEFEGSNLDVALVASGKSEDYDNYYTKQNAIEGVRNVHRFERVLYKNLYSNVDVAFFVPADSTKAVEYNFIIHPGGKIEDIKMRFDGAKTALEDSKIRMKTRFGLMDETLPMSWREDDFSKASLAIHFKNISKNLYGFEGEISKSSKTIVIDPTPVRLWGTYYGGSEYEYPYDILIDNGDEIYIIGSTKSLTNIATAGRYQSDYSGNWLDNFIAKFNADGERLWGTYAPILDLSKDHKFAVDSDSNLYMGSRELLNNELATEGAYQTEKNAFYDTYLMKYSAEGFLLWRTYYGGNQSELIESITTDSLNNVYIVGTTSSTDILASTGAYQANNTSELNNDDGFIAKFSADGQRLWGTFFGGVKNDVIKSCVVSEDNFLYVVGRSNSTNGIATDGSYIATNEAGVTSGFIAKFTLEGAKVWSTYIGPDVLPDQCVMNNGRLFISGITINEDIGTPGTYFENFTIVPDSQFGNPVDYNSFIMNFKVATQEKIWSTYFFERINKIAVNTFGEVYFCGETRTSTGITTPDAYVETKEATKKENYIVKLNENGQRVFGTYYSGNLEEFVATIALDSSSNLYLYGMTHSTDGISSPGAFQVNKGGGQELYLAKFRDCQALVKARSNSPVCVGNTVEFIATGGTNYSWTGPNGFTSALANPTIPSASNVNSGSYSCTITGTGGCDDTIVVTVVVGDVEGPVPDVAILPTITGNCNTLNIPYPTATDACSGVIQATTNSPLSYLQSGTYNVIWNYSDGVFTTTQNQTVVVSPQPLPVITSSTDFCKEDNATLSDITVSGQQIQWFTVANGGASISNTSLLTDAMTYYVSQTIAGCESERVAVTVAVYETPAPSGTNSQTFCTMQNPTLLDFIINGSDVLFYDSANGGNLLPPTTPLIDGATYFASQTLNGCESKLRLTLTCTIISSFNSTNYSQMICDDLNDVVEVIDLSVYNANLVPDDTLYGFNYYSTSSAAQSGTVANAITDFTNYKLPISSTVIYVRIFLNNSCYEVVALQLNLIPSPKLTMKDRYPICENGFVTITADAGFDSYKWSTGETTPSIVVSQGGTYAVTVTKNTSGLVCSTTKNIIVEVSERATITAVDTVDWTSSENLITILVDGSGTYEYSVDGVNFQSSNQFYGLPSGEYTVYVNDTKGCGVAKKDVYLLMYPKYFTPNGDSYNDTWGIQFYQNEINLVVKIFDRYGKFIKQLIATDPLWDGTYDGNNLPATDYWFTVIRQDGTEYKGHFTLKR